MSFQLVYASETETYLLRCVCEVQKLNWADKLQENEFGVCKWRKIYDFASIEAVDADILCIFQL